MPSIFMQCCCVAYYTHTFETISCRAKVYIYYNYVQRGCTCVCVQSGFVLYIYSRYTMPADSMRSNLPKTHAESGKSLKSVTTKCSTIQQITQTSYYTTKVFCSLLETKWAKVLNVYWISSSGLLSLLLHWFMCCAWKDYFSHTQ